MNRKRNCGRSAVMFVESGSHESTELFGPGGQPVCMGIDRMAADMGTDKRCLLTGKENDTDSFQIVSGF